jgi:OOP family OmpA-OmpF porin
MICLPRDGTCIRSYPERSFLVASLDGATQLKECRLNHVFFEFDSAELTPATKEWLDHNLRCIAVLGLDRVIIQGHADARGDAAYNQELSRRRAEAVRDYLRQKGLTAQVPIRPMGEWTPLPSGRTEREFAWERRVEFHVK